MAKTRDRLQHYRQKRDLRRSNEPAGGRRSGGGRPVFVVQKHDASSVHYDFRLEVDGVLASWAVPKGPSTDPSQRILAVRTEDHPLDYASFEGTIPEGSYGAGAVIVWDSGTYENRTADDGQEVPVADALERGHLSIDLEGEKLRGGYSLTRISRGESERWLLVKGRGEGADARRNPESTQPESVRTGRTVEQVADEEG